MKKNLKKATLVSVFLVAFSLMSLANFVCVPVTVVCSDGSGTTGSACGNTTEEIMQEAWELYAAFCGEE